MKAMTVTAAAVVLFATIAEGQTAPQAKADGEKVQGAWAGDVAVFKGVPFAAPPVGPRRWQAPQPGQPWKDVRPATQFGPRAMQLPLFGDMNFR